VIFLDAPGVWVVRGLEHDLTAEAHTIGQALRSITRFLVAHVELLGLRSGRDLTSATDSLLLGYSGVSAVDHGLLDRLCRLSLLRLACIHRMSTLVSMATT